MVNVSVSAVHWRRREAGTLNYIGLGIGTSSKLSWTRCAVGVRRIGTTLRSLSLKWRQLRGFMSR